MSGDSRAEPVRAEATDAQLPPQKRLLFWAIASIAFALIGLAVLEIGIRIAAPQPVPWFNIYDPYPEIQAYRVKPGLDVELTSGRTFRVRTDEHGHRIGAAAPAPQGQREIWFEGDSYTFGQGVNWEDSFVGQVAARLDGNFAVRNLGVGGWGPVQYLGDLEQNLAAPATPRAIVLTVYLGNDYFDCIWNKNVMIRGGVLNDPGGIRSALKQNSHLYRLLATIWRRFMPEPRQSDKIVDEMARVENWQGGELARAAAAFDDVMGRAVALARQRDVALLVVVIPSRSAVEQLGSASTGALDYQFATRRTVDLLARLGAPYIDTSEALARLGAEQAFLPIDGHLTPAANASVASEILAWLQGLPRSDTETDGAAGAN